MGKRKKSTRGQKGPKKKEPLATSFQCLFCNHEKSVTIKLLKKEGVGQLSCRVCGQSFQTGINYLSAAVDVYSDWIDACEAVAPGERTARSAPVGANNYDVPELSTRPRNTQGFDVNRPTSGRDDDDDLEGFIDNDEGDMEEEYAAE